MKHVQGLLWLLAVAAGVTVANIYYSQPLLALIGAELHAGPGATGLISTLTQAGYATGILLLVPLGDSVERRRLILISAVATIVALVGVALAPSLHLLYVASYALGVTTCAPQLVVPYAAGLVPANERGRSVGKVMSGLLVGILLSRTASGVIASHLGWRAVYLLAAGAMVALTIALRLFLPIQRPGARVTYRELLGSLPGLLRREPLLRRHALLGALSFACFSAFWTTLAYLLQTPPHHYGSDVVGLFGVVGVAGALAAPLAGKLADRHGSRFVNGLALGTVLASYLVLGLLWRSLAGLALGVVLLDLGAQANHISNQATVLGLGAAIRNRLNTVYMVSYFVGGAAGSLLGGLAWDAFGWTGVSAVGIALSLAALAAFFGYERAAAFSVDRQAEAAQAPRQNSAA
jgi:predicted MFS family arabinose efflux permease